MSDIKEIEKYLDLEGISLLAQFKKAGFRDLNITTEEALLVIHAAEARLDRTFSHEETTSKLGELLVEEDYKVLGKVSTINFTHQRI